MTIEYHKNFLKLFSKLQKREQEQVLAALKLFAENPFAEQLRNHPLKGQLSKFRSISAGGDIRLHYYEKDSTAVVVFVSVGSHAQLYG